MINYDMQRWILKQAKKRRGWIYLMKYTDPDLVTIDRDGNKSPVYIYKYGKTKNLNKRLNYYNSNYELVEAWKVDYLSLRENFIHSDWDIQQGRDDSFRDYRDEHMDFNCYDIVKHYATGEVKIITDKDDNGFIGYMVSVGDDRTMRDLRSTAMDLIKII